LFVTDQAALLRGWEWCVSCRLVCCRSTAATALCLLVTAAVALRQQHYAYLSSCQQCCGSPEGLWLWGRISAFGLLMQMCFCLQLVCHACIKPCVVFTFHERVTRVHVHVRLGKAFLRVFMHALALALQLWHLLPLYTIQTICAMGCELSGHALSWAQHTAHASLRVCC
jgi:hypothetical protein